MLHIIILILKILGMILLIIFGLLLLVILTILLVPIRYRIAVEHGDEVFNVEGSASWLLHIIHASFTRKDEQDQHIRIRLFGFIIYDNFREKPPKRDKRKASVTNQRKRKNVSKRLNATKRSKPEPTVKTVTKEYSKISDHKQNVSSDLIKIESPMLKEPDSSIHNDIEKDTTVRYPDQTLHEKLEKEETYESSETESKPSLFQKVLNKLKWLKQKVTAFFIGLKNKIIKIWKAIVNINRKKDLIFEFLQDEINKEAIKLTYQSVKKLIKHVLPTKIQSRVVFGTGDPCTTGQALGAMGILYSFYGDNIKIIPDFENKRLEGTHDARGRIRLITILIIVIKLIIDKRFKELRTNVKILKEAL